MKIAISGAHGVGKTTLVKGLQNALPTYTAIDEPYCLLAEAGHAFAETPGLADFELQLAYSIDLITDSAEDSIFDRCPADMLAYLITHNDSECCDLETWLARSQSAMERLDLLVYVPVERPDRIIVSDPSDAGLRSRVDDELCEIILGDRWGFGVDTLEASGSYAERLSQVLAYVQGEHS